MYLALPVPALWESVRLVRSPEDVLLKVGVVSFSSLETSWSGASLASLAVPGAWPTIRNCLSLDLAPALALQGDTINVKTVKFTFKPSDSSLEVLLVDRAMATDTAVRIHDARWGKATQEVVLGIIQSAQERREVTMLNQVPYRGQGVT